MKTIYLVTGAAGFMGTNVCAQLLERGDAVRAFVLKGRGTGHQDRLHPLREHGDDQPELQ